MHVHSLTHQQIEALEGLLHLRKEVEEEQGTPQGVGVRVAPPQVEVGTHLHNR